MIKATACKTVALFFFMNHNYSTYRELYHFCKRFSKKPKFTNSYIMNKLDSKESTRIHDEGEQ